MKLRRWVVSGGVAVAVIAIALLGFTLESPRSAPPAGVVTDQAATSSGSSGAAPNAAPTRMGVAAEKTAIGGVAADPNAPTGGGSGGSTPVPARMVVQTATLALDVKDVHAAVARVRALALVDGALVENLVFATGGNPTPTPLPADGQAPTASGSGTPDGQPSSAQITLRVPAEKLAHLKAAVSTLGQVQSEGASADDVTQQHVDMKARLRNLQAEEARLRSLYARAGSVGALLEVESRLSDVRGQIESLQAQIAYLERQVALATLTVSLSEPGAVVRPDTGTNWGVRDAVTLGVQSAVAVVRALITGTLAASPIIALALAVWAVVWSVRRIRRRREPATRAAETPASAD